MIPSETPVETLRAVITQLFATCQGEDWAGYDPYDALNSEVWSALPFLDFKMFRLVFVQILKRLPFNVRPLFLIKKTQNPKALALFLSAYLKMQKLDVTQKGGAIVAELLDRLVSLRAKDGRYFCWGYSFPWQTRTVLVRRGEANLVGTTFVANAFLDAYERLHSAEYLKIATSAADYIIEKLYWSEGDSLSGFSYPLPSSRVRVHNANFLGSSLLSRVYMHTGNARYLGPALNVARYSAGMQREDGSWYYGEENTQRWIDNFHTGYNLVALRSIGHYVCTREFDRHVCRGLAFYRRTFFRADGAPKYFSDRTYPIDIHSVAQSIITLTALRTLNKENVPLALAVFRWVMANMWDERGYFYYQLQPLGKIKISYMRWSQAWMLLALSTLLEAQTGTVATEGVHL